MAASLERNLVFERKLGRSRTELEKTLKWTIPLQGQTSSKQGFEHHCKGRKTHNTSSPFKPTK